MGGPSAKLYVPVFKASLLNYGSGGGDPPAKVWLSANCCVLALKLSLLYLGGPLAKVGSYAKCFVLVFKASMTY